MQLSEEETDNTPFYYENICQHNWGNALTMISSQKYNAFLEVGADPSFITFKKADERAEKSSMLQKTKSEGYKLHMSIYDSDDNDFNLARAWNIVVDMCMKHDINQVKVIKPEKRELMRTGDKCGKEITWYTFKDDFSREQIEQFLQELTDIFVENEILPGPKACHDLNEIAGSSYFTYRNDGAISLQNPFEKILINNEGQPLRMSYDNQALLPKRLAMVDDDSNDGYNQDSEDDNDCSSCCSWRR